MIFVTAADHRFAATVRHLERSVARFGYELIVYDLGGLEFGIPFRVEDAVFVEHGYYCVAHGPWKSRALHKPAVVRHCLETRREFIVYLDADTLLLDRVDEIERDYDVGVTLRRPSERGSILGQLNAGVLFFNFSERSLQFVEAWQAVTCELQNDQKALNHLYTRNPTGATIAAFPTDIYNYYYFPQAPPPGTKVLHFKDNKGDLEEYAACSL